VGTLLILADGGGFQAPGPEDFWQPLWGGDSPWAFTRPMLFGAVAFLLLVWWLLYSTRKRAMIPGKAQFVTEAVYGMVRNGVARDIIGSRDFLKYVPLLFSLFTFILVNNLWGIIPPIQFPTMSRIGFPIALSLIVFFVYHIVGMRSMGVGGYFKHMVPPGLPTAIVPIVFFLELLTYFFTRPVTLALRLFGNMFAGHVLLLLCSLGGYYLLFQSGGVIKIAGVAVYLGGVVMTAFEAFVQFLQAYVFTLLSALYIAGSLASQEH